MTKKCELTGKRPLKGHKVSHANNKVKRRFLPGIKKVNFKSDILNKSLRLNVSNSAMRSIDKKGSFSSDDEIGFAYTTIKECIDNLTEMGVITYDEEDGQTDSREEVQGQEEEE